MSRSQVRKAIATLEQLGEIRRHIQAGGTRSMADHERPNRYEILLRCPADCDGTTAHRTRRKSTRQTPLILDPGSPATPGRSDTPEGVSPATPEPSSQPNTNTDHESRVGERVRARRGDGTTYWAIFATPFCEGVGISGQRHRYSERQGCCPDCGAVPTHRSAS